MLGTYMASVCLSLRKFLSISQMVTDFPPIAEVRSVAERMKSLEPDKVIIAANRAGQLRLVMSNDTIKIETIWSNLQPGDDPNMADPQSNVSKRYASVRVDMRAFIKLLSCQFPEHQTEFFIYAGACATFVVSVERSEFSYITIALQKLLLLCIVQ
jgi:hypothetical protein